jgi:hypothetical protein
MIAFSGTVRSSVLASLIFAGAAVAAAPVHVTSEPAEINVDDARPVLASIDELSTRYGYLITYEDPEYVFAEDIRDVTEQYSRPGHTNAPPTQRILVLTGWSLRTRYEVDSSTKRPNNALSVLTRVFEAQTSAARGARFKAAESSGYIHVIPVAVRDKSGIYVPVRSLLDLDVKLESGERTGYQAFEEISAQLAAKSGKRVGVFSGPVRTLTLRKFSVPTSSGTAREVLARVAQEMDSRLTWSLLYGPGYDHFAFNFRLVPALAEPASLPSPPVRSALPTIALAPALQHADRQATAGDT